MYDFNKNLLVIRHAPTKQNKKGLCLGWIRTETEIEELDKLKQKIFDQLSREKINKIITSDLIRTIITGEYLNKHLKIKKLVSNRLFNDINFGIYGNKNPSLIKQVQPEMYDKKNFFKYDVQLKEGESLRELENRIHKGLLELKKITKKEKVLLITHGSVIVMMHKLIYDKDYYDFYPEVDINSHYKIFRF